MVGGLAICNLDIVALVPVKCLVNDFDFHDKLIINTIWPLGFGMWLGLLYAAGLLAFPRGKHCRQAILQVVYLTAR